MSAISPLCAQKRTPRSVRAAFVFQLSRQGRFYCRLEYLMALIKRECRRRRGCTQA
jgi:hypothetical protein